MASAPESNKAKIAKRVIEVLEFFDEENRDPSARGRIGFFCFGGPASGPASWAPPVRNVARFGQSSGIIAPGLDHLCQLLLGLLARCPDDSSIRCLGRCKRQTKQFSGRGHNDTDWQSLAAIFIFGNVVAPAGADICVVGHFPTERKLDRLAAVGARTFLKFCEPGTVARSYVNLGGTVFANPQAVCAISSLKDYLLHQGRINSGQRCRWPDDCDGWSGGNGWPRSRRTSAICIRSR